MLELGSNAATIVLADGDLDLAIDRCAAGGYSAAGQSCISVQRVYVARERHAELLERLAARVGRCRPATRISRRPTSAPSSTTRRPSGSRP